MIILYFAIISLAHYLSVNNLEGDMTNFNIDSLNFLTAIAFYFIAGHSYQHFVFTYFSLLSSGKINQP